MNEDRGFTMEFTKESLKSLMDKLKNKYDWDDLFTDGLENSSHIMLTVIIVVLFGLVGYSTTKVNHLERRVEKLQTYTNSISQAQMDIVMMVDDVEKNLQDQGLLPEDAVLHSWYVKK
jgi:hypothetical protein